MLFSQVLNCLSSLFPTLSNVKRPFRPNSWRQPYIESHITFPVTWIMEFYLLKILKLFTLGKLSLYKARLDVGSLINHDQLNINLQCMSIKYELLGPEHCFLLQYKSWYCAIFYRSISQCKGTSWRRWRTSCKSIRFHIKTLIIEGCSAILGR